MIMLTWLADVLKAASLSVVEEPGWQEAGRGPMGPVKGILLHHTAGSRKGNSPSLELVKNGRKDLPGPLSQLFLARNGTFHVVGAGRCNHAGAGGWHGATGNSQFIGIEAENAGDGTDPWPDVQMDAYERGVAAILTYLGLDSVMAAGHKEYCSPRGRKIDPSFDCNEFRSNVERIMSEGGGGRRVVAETVPVNSMLRKGDRGKSVSVLQDRLGLIADGDFGPQTDKAVRTFQASQGLIADGLVGPATWKALGV